MTQLQRVRKFNKTKHQVRSKRAIKVSKYLYIFFASIVGFSAVAKFYYDAGREMQAYADNGPISPVPRPTPPPTYVYQDRIVDVESLTPRSQKEMTLDYIVEVFGDYAADAIAIIRLCENSSFSQESTNENRNGTTDYGVMQINSIHIKSCGEAIKSDYKANIDCGHKIFKAAGNKFTDWTCAHIVGQKNYLGK